MDKLDEMIREALEGEDRRILEETEEQGFFALAMGIFSGKSSWANWMVMIAQTVIFLVSVWCIIEFFKAQDVLLALKWGLTGAVLFLTAGVLKMSLMPVMQGNRIIRELKRVELLLARASD